MQPNIFADDEVFHSVITLLILWILKFSLRETTTFTNAPEPARSEGHWCRASIEYAHAYGRVEVRGGPVYDDIR
jgi:hypothetical protein